MSKKCFHARHEQILFHYRYMEREESLIVQFLYVTLKAHSASVYTQNCYIFIFSHFAIIGDDDNSNSDADGKLDI